MAKLALALLLWAGLIRSGITRNTHSLKTHIVILEDDKISRRSVHEKRAFHEETLKTVTKRSTVTYSYTDVLNGFSAPLSSSDVEKLKATEGVKAVIPDSILHLHTTHSPEFMGLDKAGLFGRQETTYLGSSAAGGESAHVNSDNDDLGGEGVIIGVFDTGIWPESKSFDDSGMGPVPSGWKGSCEDGEEFSAALCNKKLIGAKSFREGLDFIISQENFTTPLDFRYNSTRDSDGHGSHTASTAAGSPVPNANLLGQAKGVARGMAPKAHLAIYKVCWGEGCVTSDILAAFDIAIQDGIHVASLSLGGLGSAFSIYDVGTFTMASQGILVVASAGNEGPEHFTLSNSSPWIMTVGASTTDRTFPATLVLGDGQSIPGKSLSVNEDGSLPSLSHLPMILGEDAMASNVTNSTESALCFPGSLSPSKVAGKIVVCTRGMSARLAKGSVVLDAGGLGMVLVNSESDGDSPVADPHVLPAINVGVSHKDKIVQYVKQAHATASLEIKGETYGVEAPSMAGFSSRGPSFSFDLLKPDITGPGVEILAAWSGIAPVAPGRNTTTDYNLISGTSMSCPHLSGLSALIKSRRPKWSPAAIRSALMTTAYVTTKDGTSPLLDEFNGKPAGVFDYGNGHVQPVPALDPGLIYDMKIEEYNTFICNANFSQGLVDIFAEAGVVCSPEVKANLISDLNYPSFTATYDFSKDKGDRTVKFNRKVTNVGGAGTYKVNVSPFPEKHVKVSVHPEELTFTSDGEEQSFTVTAILAESAPDDPFLSGRLVWTDGSHNVSSSIGFAWYDFSTLGPTGLAPGEESDIGTFKPNFRGQKSGVLAI